MGLPGIHGFNGLVTTSSFNQAGELIAHVNHMLGRGELRLETDAGGVDRYRTI